MIVPYDVALARREADHRPIRVGLLGAGNLARMIALQLGHPAPPGLRLAAVANRTGARAAALAESLGFAAREVATLGEAADVVAAGRVGISDRVEAIVDPAVIDVLVDATGSVEYSFAVAQRAIECGIPLVVANAELDATMGPWLQARASRAGVGYTNIDGDEPGVAMNLIRYVRSLGLRPVAAGNLKGMVDRYRNPDTQRAFAEQHGQNPRIVTSFADGTKLAMEAAVLANATGFRVGRPGMYGPACSHVREVADRLPASEMLAGGLVDYALGAEPHTGAFVVVHEEHPERRRWLGYLKMGSGPFYVFYTPYHLPHIQVMSTIARIVEARDATVAPMGGHPVCEVVARAKTDLVVGVPLDGPGGFSCYGEIRNWAPGGGADRAVPIGLTTGLRLCQPVRRDQAVRLGDLDLSGAGPALREWLRSDGASSGA